MADNNYIYNPSRMVEVPRGIATIGERVFYVGTFKISKSPVTEQLWEEVMGDGNSFSQKPVTNVSFAEISDFLRRLNSFRKSPGRLTIPTEAQLMMAQDGGYIRPWGKHKEICLTRFREPDEMGARHYTENRPEEPPFDLVVRQGENREPLPYNQSAKDTGFRLVLVDYSMTRRQIAAAILKALDHSEYRSFYKRDGMGCLIYFEFTGNAAKVCPPNPYNACLILYPDQVDDTIVVSTGIVRLPQEMDPDTIMDRLITLNADSKETGIRYEVPWLYHANEDTNRVLYVIKEFRALSEAYIMSALPNVITEVLAATGGFNKLFFGAK